MFNSWLIMNHKRFLVIAILFLKLVQINRKSAKKVFQRRHSNVQIKSQGHPMIVAEWKAEPSRMGTPVIHTHLMLLQIAIRMIANLAFDPSLCNGLYREANCPYYSESRRYILSGAYRYTSQKRHQKFCGLSWFPRRSRQKAAGQRNPQFQ